MVEDCHFYAIFVPVESHLTPSFPPSPAGRAEALDGQDHEALSGRHPCPREAGGPASETRRRPRLILRHARGRSLTRQERAEDNLYFK